MVEGGINVPGWMVVGAISAAGLIGLGLKAAAWRDDVKTWAEERFLPRGEFRPPDCESRARECAAVFMPRAEAEQALKHRADRMHELGNEMQKYVARERERDALLTRMEILLRVIADKLGVPPTL